MGRLAAAEQVDAALAYGTPEGELECARPQGTQYDCEVAVSSGILVYFLVGEPGDSPGRVWWVAQVTD